MEIKNETRMTAQEFGSMMQKANTKINPIITLIGVIIFGIITLAMIVCYCIELEWMKFYYLLIAAIFLGLSIAFYCLPKTFANVSVKQNTHIKDGVIYNYVFKDDCFDVESRVNGQNGSCTIKYSSLYNVVDKKDFAIIYISKVQIYLCKYDSFAEDEREECLQKLLSYSKKKRK